MMMSHQEQPLSEIQLYELITDRCWCEHTQVCEEQGYELCMTGRRLNLWLRHRSYVCQMIAYRLDMPHTGPANQTGYM